MKNGFLPISRDFYNKIRKLPLNARDLYLYLLFNASFADHIRGNNFIKKGHIEVSLSELQHATRWMDGAVTKKHLIKQIRTALKTLETQGLIKKDAPQGIPQGTPPH